MMILLQVFDYLMLYCVLVLHQYDWPCCLTNFCVAQGADAPVANDWEEKAEIV